MINNKIIFIIPAFNEEKSIVETCNSIYQYNQTHKSNFDLIVVNDGSTDNTEKVLQKNKIEHLKLNKNLGIGSAVQAGLKYANRNNYDIAIQFDGDGQHDINSINELINPIINKNFDMVIGSRFIEQTTDNFKSSKARRAGIKLISFFIKLFTKTKIYDTTSGYRAMNKRTIATLSNNYPIEYPEPVSTTRLLKLNFNICEVPAKMKERLSGKSSISSLKSTYYMINVILSIIFESLGGYKHEY